MEQKSIVTAFYSQIFFPPYFGQHVNLLDHLMYDSPKFYSLNARVFWGFQRVWRGINGLQGGLHKHTYTARVPVNPVMGGRGRVDAGPESAGWGGGERGALSTGTPNSPAPGRGYRSVMSPQGSPGGSVVRSLPADAGDGGSIPGPGRSHMLQGN